MAFAQLIELFGIGVMQSMDAWWARRLLTICNVTDMPVSDRLYLSQALDFQQQSMTT